MFPIALDLTKIPVLLVGKGRMLEKRKLQLQETRATNVLILDSRLPTQAEVAACGVVMACGLDRDDSEAVAMLARAHGKLINVEDVIDLCDFFFTANVRRGDLLIAVSTGGASPTLARRVRDAIGQMFGEEWADRVAELASARLTWRAEGAGMKEVMSRTDAILAEKGWLP